MPRLTALTSPAGLSSPGRQTRSEPSHANTGSIYKEQAAGDIDHTFLTSLVDQHGTLRVQYMGVRFDPDELLRDLQSLLVEGAAR